MIDNFDEEREGGAWVACVARCVTVTDRETVRGGGVKGGWNQVRWWG